ncbi:MAG: site-specific integrase [Alphaproteobacteria bacterium]|nr:site-specific integrase [Alphaproteobacteria bacterium]
MRIFRRKGSPHWWYDFAIRGRRFRGSTQTDDRQLADQIASKLRTDELLSVTTGKRPTLTLDGAFGKWWIEHGQYLRSAGRTENAADNLLRRLGKTVMLDSVDDAMVTRHVARRRAQVSDSSVNRELALLRSIMRMADRKWKVAVGQVDWSLHRLAEPEGRERFLSPEEADRLMVAAAPHLRPVIACALMTGLRRGNIIALDWRQVDLRAGLITVGAKSRRPGGKRLVVPIAAPLLTILANMAPCAEGRVFAGWKRPGRRGETMPLGDIKTAWRAACARAGLPGVRFHDLRHTAASWMIQAGVPLDVVQKILGHSDIKLTQRYAHRAPGAPREAVEAIGRQWSPAGTITAHAPKARKARA